MKSKLVVARLSFSIYLLISASFTTVAIQSDHPITSMLPAAIVSFRHAFIHRHVAPIQLLPETPVLHYCEYPSTVTDASPFIGLQFN